ncbi:MAG: hypothetical protein KAV18_04420 [Candidatus Omnitrophica bacterium]|nr:hypothetical protein [Candidatus Omnitrophota bacterium]
MEFDLTTFIAKMITDVIGKGKWARLIVKIYMQYYVILNFAIVLGVGVLIQTVVSGINMPFGVLLGYASAFIWDFLMTVGPLGHIWGFNLKGYEKIVDKSIKSKEEEKEEKIKKK